MVSIIFENVLNFIFKLLIKYVNTVLLVLIFRLRSLTTSWTFSTALSTRSSTPCYFWIFPHLFHFTFILLLFIIHSVCFCIRSLMKYNLWFFNNTSSLFKILWMILLWFEPLIIELRLIVIYRWCRIRVIMHH